MKIIREESKDFGFKYIAYIPNKISDNPAILFQLHGAGERGEDLSKVLVHGIANITNDQNLKDCILMNCPNLCGQHKKGLYGS